MQLAQTWPRVTKRHGTSFVRQPADNGPEEAVTAHFVSPSPQDQALVNALGLEARILHALATPRLVKFDRLVDPSGRAWTIEAVHDVWSNNRLVGQKLYAR